MKIQELKAKELRAGNYIIFNVNNKPFPVTTTEILQVANIEGKLTPYFYEPVPLTEELLLKCGFMVRHIDGSDGIFRIYNLGAFTYNTNHGWWYLLDKLRFQITSLHQLQNLYYSLTNTELQILPLI